MTAPAADHLASLGGDLPDPAAGPDVAQALDVMDVVAREAWRAMDSESDSPSACKPLLRAPGDKAEVAYADNSVASRPWTTIAGNTDNALSDASPDNELWLLV